MIMNLFQLSSNDQSVYYLGQIFGIVGTLLPTSSTNPLVGIMFKVFNTSILTIGVILIIYITVVGLLKTAQEGEFLGKQWNSLWVPIRTVLGIISLVPTTSGYSVIQIVMMWIVVQGIGAADTLWTSVIKYTEVMNGSPFTTVDVPITDVSMKMSTLFQGLVCQAAARGPSTGNMGDIKTNQIDVLTGGFSPITIKYYCNNPANQGDAFCRGSTDMLNILGPQSNGKNAYSMGPGASQGTGGACGTVTFCNATADGSDAQCKNPNSKECLACKAQHGALQSIIPILGQIAQAFVDSDYNFSGFREQCFTNPAKDECIKGLIAPTPSWVANYCSEQNIPTSQCCAFGAGCSSGVKRFSDLGKDNDPSNLSDDTVKNLYMIYQLKPQLGVNVGFVDASVNQYVSGVTSAVNEYISRQLLNPTTRSGDEWDWVADAKAQGWILAGAYYYYMSNLNKGSMQAAVPTLTVEFMDPSLGKGDSARMAIYRHDFTATKALFAGIASAQSAAGGAPPSFGLPSEFGGVTSQLGAAQSSLLHTFMTNLSEGDNTLKAANRGAPMASNAMARISTFGYSLMITAQVLFSVIVLSAFLFGLFGSINFMVLGTGMTLNPLWQGIQAVLSVVSPFIALLLTAIYSLGATLGIYVPLIPLVVFTVGAIGWFIGVIEAMVAAPIVALGILSPGGQHDILGRAEPALMTILNTFLRPSLMIFGLMIAMLLSNVVVNLINAGFLAAAKQIISAPGLFESILFIASYVSLIVTALNKAFSLIYMLPERVLTWIGGHAVQYGEGEALGTMQRAVEGAAGASAGAGKEAGGAAASGALQQVKTQAESDYGKEGGKQTRLNDIKKDDPNIK